MSIHKLACSIPNAAKSYKENGIPQVFCTEFPGNKTSPIIYPTKPSGVCAAVFVGIRHKRHLLPTAGRWASHFCFPSRARQLSVWTVRKGVEGRWVYLARQFSSASSPVNTSSASVECITMSSGRDDSSCSKVRSSLFFRPWEEGDNSFVQRGADEDEEGGRRSVKEWQHPTLHLFQFLCGIFACSNFRTGESQLLNFSRARPNSDQSV